MDLTDGTTVVRYSLGTILSAQIHTYIEVDDSSMSSCFKMVERIQESLHCVQLMQKALRARNLRPTSHFGRCLDLITDFNQPTNQSSNQPDSQSINKSINHPINQPINAPHLRATLRCGIEPCCLDLGLLIGYSSMYLGTKQLAFV